MQEYNALVLHQGAVHSRRLQAADPDEARRLLAAEGMQVLKLDVRRGLRGARQTFSLTLFVQELVALLDAGLVLVEAIQTLHEKAASAPQAHVLQSLLNALYQGQTLSQAMAGQPAVFPSLLVASVASSEHTGQLPQALRRFNHYELRVEALRKRVKGTLIYPCAVIGVGGLILVFLLGFVVPRFATVFSGMRDLAFTGRLMVWWGRLVNEHGLALSLGLMLIVAGTVAVLRTAPVRAKLANCLWRVPRLRQQRTLFILTRFYRTLGLLLQGGMPVVEALALTGGLLPQATREELRQTIEDVRQGQALSASLERRRLTTPIAARLLRVGEKSGDLPGMCERIAQFHDEALERAIEMFSKVFEPVLMLLVGGLIGLIVFLLYMPIFEMAGSVS